MITAVRLLLLERRCERDRRVTTRFADTFPATLTRLGDRPEQFTVDVIAASADGFTLRTGNGGLVRDTGDYCAAIDISGKTFSCELSVGETRLGGALHWSDAASRAAFDLLLHLRAVERFTAADRGDGGGVRRSA